MIQQYKKCKYCKSDIDKTAKVCPVCKRSLKSHGCLIAFFVIMIPLSIIGSIILQNILIKGAITGTFDSDKYITLSEYNQIDMDMTYEEVIEIIGSEGTISSESNVAGISMIIVSWDGNGIAGSSANITFQNGKVISKFQAGLV